MWLERALSRARSRRSLACSCLGLSGSSSVITRSDLIFKTKRIKGHFWHEDHTGMDRVEKTRLCLTGWNVLFTEVYNCAKIIACCDISSNIIFPTEWLNIEWIKLCLPKLPYVISDRWTGVWKWKWKWAAERNVIHLSIYPHAQLSCSALCFIVCTCLYPLAQW